MSIAPYVMLAASLAAAPGVSDAARLSPPDATRIFARAHALCEADAGRLWGVSLCVPMLVVDPKSRDAFASSDARSTQHARVPRRLTLPADAPMSTAPIVYRGTRRAEITWPMYGSGETHDVILMHESFHVVQPRLGFDGDADNGSISGDPALDTEAGRIWLRGELHALRAALRATHGARRRALADALSMRSYRHSLFVDTAEREREQDLLEGLAESTGIDLGLPPSRRIPYALFDVSFVEAQPSYARSFSYATGPAYSELLDAVTPNWRRSIGRSSDLARMAARAYGLPDTPPTAASARTIAARYAGAAIESQENTRAARKLASAATYERELVRGPTVTLPLTHFNITFDPRDIETFSPYGSIYHTLTVTAPWGKIVVSGGNAMVSKSFRFLTIAAASNVRGARWTLTLAGGYAVVADRSKPGSYGVSLER